MVSFGLVGGLVGWVIDRFDLMELRFEWLMLGCLQSSRADGKNGRLI